MVERHFHRHALKAEKILAALDWAICQARGVASNDDVVKKLSFLLYR